MARLDRYPTRGMAEQHDGEVRCGECGSSDPAAAHEWCLASGRLVCEKCCHRTLLADIGRNMAAALFGHQVEEAGACSTCERGQRWLAGEVLEAMADGELPC